MSCRWLIAIDDTDNLESIGTGRLARMLSAELRALGIIEHPTITRHQLLVHPEIPYTSHNSSACIAASGEPDAGHAIFEAAESFLRAHPQQGANPGLCVAPESETGSAMQALARRAQREVLELARFDREIGAWPLRVWSGGETGQGRIGAVCGVALRSTGEDGRFIDLPGVREVRGRARVAEILERTGIDRVVDEQGRPLAGETAIETRDWIRPELRSGEAVFEVRLEAGEWVPRSKRIRDDG